MISLVSYMCQGSFKLKRMGPADLSGTQLTKFKNLKSANY
jgi:hypothetical protein